MTMRLRARVESRPVGVPGEVTQELLAKINAMEGVLRPLSPNDVIIRAVQLLNDRPFKDGRRVIPADELRKIVPLAPGTPVMLAHATFMPGSDGLPVGTTIDGLIEKDGDTTWLTLRYFTLRVHPFLDPQALISNVDGGVIKEASAGLYYDTMTCSICGEDPFECEHAMGKVYPGQGKALAQIRKVTDLDEWSYVYAGMVDGTGFRLAASRETPDPDVELLERLAKLRPMGRCSWDQLLPNSVALRRERREKFQSFMKSTPAGA